MDTIKLNLSSAVDVIAEFDRSVKDAQPDVERRIVNEIERLLNSSSTKAQLLQFGSVLYTFENEDDEPFDFAEDEYTESVNMTVWKNFSPTVIEQLCKLGYSVEPVGTKSLKISMDAASFTVARNMGGDNDTE